MQAITARMPVFKENTATVWEHDWLVGSCCRAGCRQYWLGRTCGDAWLIGARGCADGGLEHDEGQPRLLWSDPPRVADVARGGGTDCFGGCVVRSGPSRVSPASCRPFLSSRRSVCTPWLMFAPCQDDLFKRFGSRSKKLQSGMKLLMLMLCMETVDSAVVEQILEDVQVCPGGSCGTVGLTFFPSLTLHVCVLYGVVRTTPSRPCLPWRRYYSAHHVCVCYCRRHALRCRANGSETWASCGLSVFMCYHARARVYLCVQGEGEEGENNPVVATDADVCAMPPVVAESGVTCPATVAVSSSASYSAPHFEDDHE